MKCFYHNDNDGRLSAYLVMRYVYGTPGRSLYQEDFIEMNYDREFPMDVVEWGEEVWIVDYHIPPEQMRELLKITPNVMWIDHHKTAIEKYKDFEPKLDGWRTTEWAACMLTWMYTHNIKEIPPFNQIPAVIQLVDDWDCWKHQIPQTRFFHAGSQAQDTSPFGYFWKDCINLPNGVSKIIEDGRIVTAYRNIRAYEYSRAFGYETEFEGHLCFVMNIGIAGRDWFWSVEKEFPEVHDIFICCVHNGSQWIVTLYGNKGVDVSKIAVKHGGGGHPGAAGFECEELPFSKLEK